MNSQTQKYSKKGKKSHKIRLSSTIKQSIVPISMEVHNNFWCISILFRWCEIPLINYSTCWNWYLVAFLLIVWEKSMFGNVTTVKLFNMCISQRKPIINTDWLSAESPVLYTSIGIWLILHNKVNRTPPNNVSNVNALRWPAQKNSQFSSVTREKNALKRTNVMRTPQKMYSCCFLFINNNFHEFINKPSVCHLVGSQTKREKKKK